MITNSTFSDNLGSGFVMSFDTAEVEMRNTNFENNKMLGPSGTTLRTVESKLRLREKVFFVNNEGVTGGALRMSSHSSLISTGTQFVKNTAHEMGGAIMISEAYEVTLRETNFTENRSSKIASVIWASNGHGKTNIVA